MGSLLLINILVGVAAADSRYLVGSGGCDVSAVACSPPASPLGQQVVALDGGHVTSNTSTPGSPSWLHMAGSCVFAAVTDTDQVASFKLGADGALTPASVLPSAGRNPVKLDTAGPILLAANYGGTGGASVASFMFDEASCSLRAGTSVPFNRSSIDPKRQATSHVHTVVVDAAASTATTVNLLAADLGGDAIYTLQVAFGGGDLRLLHTASTKPGSGPRHIAIHPSKRVAYCVHEMSNELSVHRIGSDGALKLIQTVSTLPNVTVPSCVGLQLDVQPTVCSKAAEIVATPDGVRRRQPNPARPYSQDGILIAAQASP